MNESNYSIKYYGAGLCKWISWDEEVSYSSIEEAKKVFDTIKAEKPYITLAIVEEKIVAISFAN